MEVHIYIETDSKAPKLCTRKYGYVLACILKGKLETKQEFRETKGTYNRATLEAITEAVGRVVKPSEIHIHNVNELGSGKSDAPCALQKLIPTLASL